MIGCWFAGTEEATTTTSISAWKERPKGGEERGTPCFYTHVLGDPLPLFPFFLPTSLSFHAERSLTPSPKVGLAGCGSVHTFVLQESRLSLSLAFLRVLLLPCIVVIPAGCCCGVFYSYYVGYICAHTLKAFPTKRHLCSYRYSI